MAYHFTEPGSTPLVIGAVYWSGKSWNRHRYELKSVNAATGIARLEPLTGAWLFDVFMNAAVLTNCVIVR